MANKPIFGNVARGEDVHRFREKKIELKERGYPKEETKKFVQEYFEKVKDLVTQHVDSKTLLIKVPSGSGENKIPVFFSNEISKLTGAGVLPDNLITKTHKGEAKKNLSLEKRNADPIGYEINGRLIKEIARDYSKVLVLDDLIGSGESSIRLVKTLEKAGIQISGLVNLVTVEKRYPTPADLNRVYNKINQHAKLLMTDSVKLSSNLKTVFTDYTRQKLNRFEREIKNEPTAIKAFKNLSKGATIEKEFDKEIGKHLGI